MEGDPGGWGDGLGAGGDAGGAGTGDFGFDDGAGVGVDDVDAFAEAAWFGGHALGGELDAGAIELQEQGRALEHDDGTAEVREGDRLAGLDWMAESLADGLGGLADDVGAGEAGAEAGPLQVGGGEDVAGHHGPAGDGQLGHGLDPAGEAHLGRGHAVDGGGEEGGEAAGPGVELGCGEFERGFRVAREEGGVDAGQLDVAVAGGAGFLEDLAEGGEDVLADEGSAGAFEDGAVAGAGGVPVDAEHVGDCGQLWRLHGDAAAGARGGAERAVVGAVEQVGEADDAFGERRVGAERGGRGWEGGEGEEESELHGGHRRFVRVCCIWSLVVMTRLFIS